MLTTNPNCQKYLIGVIGFDFEPYPHAPKLNDTDYGNNIIINGEYTPHLSLLCLRRLKRIKQ